MESSGPPAAITKKLKHILRVVYCMIRKSFISRRKFILDLHLLLERTKIIGKAMANTLTSNNSAFSCNIPQEVEFSCSNTPSYPVFHVSKRKNRNHRHRESYGYETAASVVSEGFEMLNDDEISDAEYSVVNSPMSVVDGRVDEEAEKFIKRFYQQLKIQQRTVMTPLHEFHRR